MARGDDVAAEREVWLAAHYGDPRYTLLSTVEAAERVKVSPSTIRTWAHRGKLRPLTVEDGRPYYRASDVLDVHRQVRGLPGREELRELGREFMASLAAGELPT